jgi:selenocysteine lyase/cysteine desulfurase
MTGPLSCRKSLFSLPEDLHYLNCAYMGPLPRVVEEAGIEGMRRKRVPSTIAASDFFEQSDEARRLFARLIGAPEPGRVAIIPAVSYGMATAARNTSARRGQNVVVVSEQFPSNVYAWRRLAAERGLELRTVTPPDSPRRGEDWNAALLAAIDGDTALVALPVVHWTDGTRFDLEEVGRRARAAGAAFVIDASQSVGALPFDITRVGADALVTAAYKWLLGPYSIGLAWFGPRYDGGVPLEETWIGRRGSEDFRGLVNYRDEYQPGAVRYDVGERSNFILMPMLVAALRLILEWRPERIQQYCAELMAAALEEARELGFVIEDPAWRGHHLFGLRAPAGIDLAALNDTLREHGVSASLRGSALRVSPNVYNDEADVAALVRALRQVAAASSA